MPFQRNFNILCDFPYLLLMLDLLLSVFSKVSRMPEKKQRHVKGVSSCDLASRHLKVDEEPSFPVRISRGICRLAL
jgi:hypothetical protein